MERFLGPCWDKWGSFAQSNHAAFTPRNYGPTVLVQQEAQKNGCEQVLWLYGPDQQLTRTGVSPPVPQLFHDLCGWYRGWGGVAERVTSG
jgi:hypothetical protein